jgi:hypothetical protein
MFMVGGIRIELMTSFVSRKARREAALAEKHEKCGIIRALAFCHLPPYRHGVAGEEGGSEVPTGVISRSEINPGSESAP